MIELTTDQIDAFLAEAIAEAHLGWDEGGIPIGSVLVKNGVVIGRGHNRRHQQGSAILHAEMDCLENAVRLTAADYRECVLSRLSHRAICVAELRCSTKFLRSLSERMLPFADRKSISDRAASS